MKYAAVFTVESTVPVAVALGEAAHRHVPPTVARSAVETHYEGIALGGEVEFRAAAFPLRIGHGYVITIGARILLRPHVVAEDLIGKRYVVSVRLFLFAQLDAGSVVIGPERFAGLHGDVEACLCRGQRGQLQRQGGFGDVVACRG